ncbi:MAG: SCO family protein [Candidatus Thiodiazotropha sp.]|jgi:protein SCO1
MRDRYIYTGLAVLPLFLMSAGVTASENDNKSNYAQYAVEGRDKPFEMDCATKHAKYLPQADNGQENQFTLASISGDAAGVLTHRQALSRSTYSRKLAVYEAPDVELIAEDNRAIQFADLLATDRPVMLNFIFTTCTTICPVLSASFKQVQDLMGSEAKEVLMISITIDPEYDTPEKLADYADRFSAGEQWTFLTGQIDDVVRVEKAFDIFRGSKTNHEPVTLIRSADKAEWVRIEGFANAEEIVAEYKKINQRDG